MENILGNIYCWFESLFGQNLGDHLWGFDGVNYTLPIQFNTIGLITLVVSFLIIILYYYGINDTRFNKLWSWSLMLIINATINLFIGYGITVNDFLNGNIADVLMYSRDDSGDIVADLITKGDCWGFGIANIFVSILFFALWTLICKWWSRNAKYSPF